MKTVPNCHANTTYKNFIGIEKTKSCLFRVKFSRVYNTIFDTAKLIQKVQVPHKNR